MRAVAAALLALLAAVAVPAAAQTPSGRRASVEFTDLRVCPYEAFSKDRKICVKDEHAMILTSKTFACSVRVVARQRTQISARLTYRGKTIYEYSSPLALGSWDWWISVGLMMGQPQPGGPWHCEFSAATARVSADFQSGGPTGPVVDVEVCPATTAYESGTVLICPSDMSDSIRANEDVVCNAVYVGQKGKSAGIDLLAGGVPKTRNRSFKLLFPIEIVYQLLDAQAAGDYSCVYKLDGANVVEKPFRVVNPVPSPFQRTP